jgi:hypothetical protein
VVGIVSTGKVLGAKVLGTDLSRPLGALAFTGCLG